MKKDYYALLGVEREADAAALKRAYYTKVKKFPPERFPEEFKELRAAYDVLGNPEKRAEYDQTFRLPGEAVYLLDQAKEQKRLGMNAKAVDIYEQTLRLFPDLTEALFGLAHAYEAQGKTGKAGAIWEKLCAREPDNALYRYELALGYDRRGWRKKAAEAYRRSLELDGGNAECWESLVDCLLEQLGPSGTVETCFEGIGALSKHGRESMRMYVYGALLTMNNDLTKAEACMRSVMGALQQGGRNVRNLPAELVLLLLESVMGNHAYTMLPLVEEIASLLPEMGEELSENLKRAALVAEIETLGDAGEYDVLFHDLFATLDEGCRCEDCRLELMAMECHILMEQETYRPQLLRLKEEKPHLYAMHAAFFNEALRGRNTEKLLYQRAKAMSKKGVAPAGFGEPDSGEDGVSAPVQTVRREAPKVGRNDPCPCGSGKKYKKCCGR